MRAFDIGSDIRFATRRHVEKVLVAEHGGDFSVACWEAGQISPYHCHPEAIEAYYCVMGGGTMRTPAGSISLAPGALVIHPLGELHEYENGSERSVLLRVRYGEDVGGYELARRGDPSWRQPDRDAAFFRLHPPPSVIAPK
jgi:quercetin dioxygenase-like cupin family protein